MTGKLHSLTYKLKNPKKLKPQTQNLYPKTNICKPKLIHPEPENQKSKLNPDPNHPNTENLSA